MAAVEEDAVTIELRRGGGPDEETEAQGAAAGVEEAEDDNAREEEGERKAEGGKATPATSVSATSSYCFSFLSSGSLRSCPPDQRWIEQG